MDGMVLARRELGDDLVAALAERAAAVDREGRFPYESLELLHAEGLLNLTARRVDGTDLRHATHPSPCRRAIHLAGACARDDRPQRRAVRRADQRLAGGAGAGHAGPRRIAGHDGAAQR